MLVSNSFCFFSFAKKPVSFADVTFQEATSGFRQTQKQLEEARDKLEVDLRQARNRIADLEQQLDLATASTEGYSCVSLLECLMLRLDRLQQIRSVTRTLHDEEHKRAEAESEANALSRANRRMEQVIETHTEERRTLDERVTRLTSDLQKERQKCVEAVEQSQRSEIECGKVTISLLFRGTSFSCPVLLAPVEAQE